MIVEFLAQVPDISPIAPPGAERFLWLVNIFSWFCYLSATLGIVYGGGRFAWEKFVRGGDLESPKIIAAAMIGGIVMALAPTLMRAAIGGGG